MLFNCSQPEVMDAAVTAAVAELRSIGRSDLRVGVYANTFEPEPPSDAAYAGISEMRGDLEPKRYLELVKQWVASGATIVGGCCGIGPEHIAAIAAHLESDRAKAASNPMTRQPHAESGHDVCHACRA